MGRPRACGRAIARASRRRDGDAGDRRRAVRRAAHRAGISAAAGTRRPHERQHHAHRPVRVLGTVVAAGDRVGDGAGPVLVRHVVPGRRAQRMGQPLRARTRHSALAALARLAVRGVLLRHRLWPTGQRVRVSAAGPGGAGRLDDRGDGGGLPVRPRQARVVPPSVPGERRVRAARARGAAALPRRSPALGDEHRQPRCRQLRAARRYPPHDRSSAMPYVRPVQRPARGRAPGPEAAGPRGGGRDGPDRQAMGGAPARVRAHRHRHRRLSVVRLTVVRGHQAILRWLGRHARGNKCGCSTPPRRGGC